MNEDDELYEEILAELVFQFETEHCRVDDLEGRIRKELGNDVQSLISRAKLAAKAEADGDSWKGARQKLKDLEKASKAWARAARRLSDDDLRLLNGENPFNANFQMTQRAAEVQEEAMDAAARRVEAGEGAETELKTDYETWGKILDTRLDSPDDGYFSEIPPLIADEENPLERPLVLMMEQVANAAEAAETRLLLATDGMKGRGRMREKLGANDARNFVAACGGLFGALEFPIRNSDSSRFFRFCASLYDHFAYPRVLDGRGFFYEVCYQLQELETVRRQIQEVLENLSSVPLIHSRYELLTKLRRVPDGRQFDTRVIMVPEADEEGGRDIAVVEFRKPAPEHQAAFERLKRKLDELSQRERELVRGLSPPRPSVKPQ